MDMSKKKTYHATIPLAGGVASLQDLLNSNGGAIDLKGWLLTSLQIQPHGGKIRFSLDQNPPIANRFSPWLNESQKEVFTGYNFAGIRLVPDAVSPATELSVEIHYHSARGSQTSSSSVLPVIEGLAFGFGSVAFGFGSYKFGNN